MTYHISYLASLKGQLKTMGILYFNGCRVVLHPVTEGVEHDPFQFRVQRKSARHLKGASISRCVGGPYPSDHFNVDMLLSMDGSRVSFSCKKRRRMAQVEWCYSHILRKRRWWRQKRESRKRSEGEIPCIYTRSRDFPESDIAAKKEQEIACATARALNYRTFH